MEHRIENLAEKKLIGMSIEMSFSENKTSELWRAFMPVKNKVPNRVNTNHYSLQQYTGNNNPMLHGLNKPFTKWALVEVDNHDIVPDGMSAYTLPEGMYAVFKHKGTAPAAMPLINYIFSEWVNTSEYELDTRPHFEILPEGYNPMDPEAEEEFWIPVKLKSTD